MNDYTESSNSTSAKHVSFSQLVQVIDDSAFEYVDLPPIIYEPFNDSDSVMSITELTESTISDRYYDTNQFQPGRSSYDMNVGNISYDEINSEGGRSEHRIHEENIKEVPAVPIHNRDDLASDDGLEQQSTNEGGWISYLFGALGLVLVGVSIVKAIGCLSGMFCSNHNLPADHDDAVAIAVGASTGANKGFILSSFVGDGGSTYITYV
jgi:hypothetical protein